MGDTKIVLPLTWVVYCEAPITVARIPSAGLSSRTPHSETRLRISSPSSAPRSPKPDVSQPKMYSATPPENVTASIVPR